MRVRVLFTVKPGTSDNEQEFIHEVAAHWKMKAWRYLLSDPLILPAQ